MRESLDSTSSSERATDLCAGQIRKESALYLPKGCSPRTYCLHAAAKIKTCEELPGKKNPPDFLSRWAVQASKPSWAPGTPAEQKCWSREACDEMRPPTGSHPQWPACRQSPQLTSLFPPLTQWAPYATLGAQFLGQACTLAGVRSSRCLASRSC